MKYLLPVLSVLLITATSSLAANKPNIVVFLADDMGWGDLGCYGNKIIKSPNLDEFATEGVRFTQCYSACGVPLFWRTHIAPEKSQAAMRIGDWKIVADCTLSEFQLYEIEKDWQEKTDLAAQNPEKLGEMKKKFMEVWRGIEAEGPREWWENEPPKQKRKMPNKAKKKSGKIGEGKDETGDWPIVSGGTVTKSELGYRLTSALTSLLR